MHLLSIAIKIGFMVFVDVSRSYWKAPGTLYQTGKSLLQVAFYKCAVVIRYPTKGKENFEKGEEMSFSIISNLILHSFHCRMWTRSRRG